MKYITLCIDVIIALVSVWTIYYILKLSINKR